jgi:hypothetical protein
MSCPLTEASTAQSSSDKNPQFAYCERVFLHPPTTGKNSYICAIAESSEAGTYKAGDYVLILADCHHAIELEFSLINSKQREESLAKVDALVNIVNRFRDALHTEAKVIESVSE